MVSAYTDISVRGVRDQEPAVLLIAEGAPVLEHTLELLAFRGVLVEHLLERSAFRMSGLSTTSCAPAATRRLSALGLRAS